MTVRKFLDYLIAAISGWTVVQAGKFLAEKDFWFVEIAPPIVAVATFFLLHRLESLLVQNNHLMRQWIIAVARFEGRWIGYSRRHGRNHYGIFHLRYDKEKGQHFVDGNSFIDSGELVASWHS